MIPELPPSVSDNERCDFYATLLGNMSDQSTIHVNWHTHRQNPATCWICDLVTLSAKVLDLYDKNISKSSLDIETRLSSEEDSDTEIEDDINDSVINDERQVDTFNCPEYEVDEDGYRSKLGSED